MNFTKFHGDERMRRENPAFRRPSFFSLVIPVFSLLFLSACQNPTQSTATQRPTASTEAGPILPKVTLLNTSGLVEILKPKGRPLLVNFWATWCEPCREEFPDLVRIGKDNEGKLDLITVSLDEAAEIDGAVPQFLAQMRSPSPAFLLKTPDEDEAIALVSKDWQGALPFTILFNAQGEAIYSKQGKFKSDVLETEIERLY